MMQEKTSALRGFALMLTLGSSLLPASPATEAGDFGGEVCHQARSGDISALYLLLTQQFLG